MSKKNKSKKNKANKTSIQNINKQRDKDLGNWYDGDRAIYSILAILALIFTLIGLSFAIEGRDNPLPYISFFWWLFLFIALTIGSFVDPFFKNNIGISWHKGSVVLMMLACLGLGEALNNNEKQLIDFMIIATGIIGFLGIIFVFRYLVKRHVSVKNEAQESNIVYFFYLTYFLLLAILSINLLVTYIKWYNGVLFFDNGALVAWDRIGRFLGPQAENMLSSAGFMSIPIILLLIVTYNSTSGKLQCVSIWGIYTALIYTFNFVCVYRDDTSFALRVVTSIFASLGSIYVFCGFLMPLLYKYVIPKKKTSYQKKKEMEAAKRKASEAAKRKVSEAAKEKKSQHFEYHVDFDVEVDALKEVYDKLIQDDSMKELRNISISFEEAGQYQTKMKCTIRRPFIYNLFGSLASSYDEKMTKKINEKLVAAIRSKIYIL